MTGTLALAATPARAGTASARRWAGVAFLCLMQLMLVVDSSVVNVALPRIQAELGFTPAGLSWVVTAYALVFGGLVLLSGSIGSIIGARRALTIGAGVFVPASAVGGLADTPAMLIGARALQGLGAALAAPSTLVLLTSISAPGRERARAMTLFVVAIGSGAALGLVLGGILTTALGWEWVMFVNVPIGLAVILGVRSLVPEAPRSPARLDIAGAVASTVGMAATVFALTGVPEYGWGSGRVLGSGALAVFGFLVLILVERRHPSPVLPLSFFTAMRSAAPVLAMLLVPAGQFGMIYFAAVFTQQVLGYSPLHAGLAVLPFTLALLAANFLTPRLVVRHGERIVGSAGMTGLALGLLWLSQVGANSDFLGGLFGPFVVLGLGAGLTIAPLTTVLLAQAPAGRLGAASGLNQGMQQLGGAVGLAVFSTVSGTVSGGAVDPFGLTRGLTTALLFVCVFPVIALVLFATWGRSKSTMAMSTVDR